MFELNKEYKTKSGELLTPITQEGDYVLCADRHGKTVYRRQKEFDNVEIKKSKTIMAIPKTKSIYPKEIIVPVSKQEKIIVPEIKKEITAEPEKIIVPEMKKEIKKSAKGNKESQRITKKMVENTVKKISKDNNIDEGTDHI
jgi:hypothetical protein